MILALTGMMGSGKTTVGRLVADALGCPFMDMDELVARKAGAQNRPLSGDWAALLEARASLYAAAAHVTLDTDGAAPETLADEIIISVL